MANLDGAMPRVSIVRGNACPRSPRKRVRHVVQFKRFRVLRRQQSSFLYVLRVRENVCCIPSFT